VRRVQFSVAKIYLLVEYKKFHTNSARFGNYAMLYFCVMTIAVTTTLKERH
jgi:hypothetical protein